MDLDTLNSFVVLSQYLNYTKAAAALHMTQPTLSKCIVRLEQELGKQLIFRNNRGVFLTEDGEKALRYAKQILSSHTALLEELNAPANEVNGHLRVGFLGHCTHQFFPGFIKEYRAKYPGVSVALLDGDQEFLIKAFLDGRLDVLIATEAACDTLQHCQKTLLNTEQIYLLVPSDSKYAGQESVDIEELKDEAFVCLGNYHSYLAPSHNPSNLLFRICAAHKFFPKTVTCSRLSNLPLMVACKMGYAIATSALKFYARSCVTFVPIKGHELDRYRIYAFYDELNLTNATTFINLFQAYIQKKQEAEPTC